jgi:formylglycine-generating enzyme required for sulfatase activity
VEDQHVSPKMWSKLTGLSASLLLLCWPLIATDVESESDVDLTVTVRREPFINSIGMKFVPVLAGTFVMGSPKDEKERESFAEEKGCEEQHEVELTRDFYLGVTEVTQKQYKAVMGYHPSYFSNDGKPAPKGQYPSTEPCKGKDKVKGLNTDDFPVENVSWDDAQEFLKKLNALAAEKKFGVAYRLPTEAQWEYACRGGHLIADRKKAQLPFHFKTPTGSLGFGQANFGARVPYGGGKAGVSLQRTNTVGRNGEPNALGLYDMHGNVSELCADWYARWYYPSGPRTDPTGPLRGLWRVTRGGWWNGGGGYCRAACRGCNEPSERHFSTGFRVAAVPYP